jgi:Uma2 family endonuclease
MKYSDEKPARAPDIMVILNAHRDRMRDTYIDRIADVVVEIVLPESDIRDYADKLTEYEAAGALECWLIDPQRR